MWDVNAEPKTLIADFYDKAFGPAALPMERYYTRWLGPGDVVRIEIDGIGVIENRFE